MKTRLLEILVCPSCANEYPFDLKNEEMHESEIESGLLVCTNCNSQYQIVDSIPRFVHSDSYADSFGFEWNLFSKVQIDRIGQSNESENTIKDKTRLTPNKVEGKIVLDAGAGAGRFAEVVSRWGARDVLAVDISRAVDACYENIGDRSNVHVIQADLFHLPFRAGFFDIVYSIGVLHHTPDTHKAFCEISELVKSGGFLGIYVYCVTSGMGYSDHIRRITRKIPRRLLYYFSLLAVPVYYLYQIPVIGTMMSAFFPISMHPNWRWRWLDTFDWYSEVSPKIWTGV